MKKAVLVFVLGVLSAHVQAIPRIEPETVTFSQNASRRVTIQYQLDGEPAVVTFDIQTNYVEGTEIGWASIGEEKFAHAVGDVFRLVQPSDTLRTIHWAAHRDWPGQEIPAGGIRAVVTAWSTNAPPDYAVCDLSGEEPMRYYVSAGQIPEGLSDDAYRTRKLVLRRIPAAGVEYRKGKVGGSGDEIAYRVSLSEDFYMGVFEFTQGQYKTLFGSYPASQKQVGDDRGLHPMIASYRDMRGINTWPEDNHEGIPATSIAGKLAAVIGMRFDLPTEAQWEYACRAGSGARYFFGEDVSLLGDYAWYADNSEGHSHPVGTRLPNAWGLYDIAGNMMEHVLDWRSFDPRSFGTLDPVGPPTGDAGVKNGNRFIRGGAFNSTYDCLFSHGSKAGADVSALSNAGVYGARVVAPAIAVR